MTRYYKATASNGRIVTRCTDSKIYTSAFIPDAGDRAAFASEGKTPSDVGRRAGELVPTVEIDASHYRALRRAGHR